MIVVNHLPGLLVNKSSISKKVLRTHRQDAQIADKPKKQTLMLLSKCIRQLVVNAARRVKCHFSQEGTNLSIAVIVSEQ